MTPAAWAEREFPLPLLQFLADDRRLTPRKSRLFACACARMVWRTVTEADSQRAVEIAERFADRLESHIGLRIAQRFAQDHCDTFPSNMPLQLAFLTAEPEVHVAAVAHTTFEVMVPDYHERSGPAGKAANRRLANLVREIFPFPDRPFDPAWQTAAVLELANGMYGARDFTAMPILADAIEEAGCSDADLLSHCRDLNGEHFRGCWLVDLVRGEL